MKTPPLKSSQFRREREKSWQELERLVTQAKKRGVGSLSAYELRRLPILYRNALSSLSVARAISLDRNLLHYLENLCARGFLSVYGVDRRFRGVILDFFRDRFPRTVTSHARLMLLSAAFMLLGLAIGFMLTTQDMDRYYQIVPDAVHQGRTPASSTEELREILYTEEDWSETLLAFASFLFTNNSRVGILCFSLGIVVGAPVFYLLLYNGMLLGAMAALYHHHGLSADFWGWILPHGVTELMAIVLCGGAGLMIAQRIIAPGRYGRRYSLAQAGRQAGVVVMGCILLFFLAALVEGFFRQIVDSMAVRYAVAATSAVLWGAYFSRGREPA